MFINGLTGANVLTMVPFTVGVASIQSALDRTVSPVGVVIVVFCAYGARISSARPRFVDHSALKPSFVSETDAG